MLREGRFHVFVNCLYLLIYDIRNYYNVKDNTRNLWNYLKTPSGTHHFFCSSISDICAVILNKQWENVLNVFEIKDDSLIYLNHCALKLK